MSSADVLIVDSGWGRGTLAATRSLARAGHRVSVASQEAGHAARSRYSCGWFELPSPHDPSFGERVARVVDGGSFQVVFAGDDEHLLALSERREVLGGAVFPHPAHETVLRALDKLSLYEAAARCGLGVPETCPSRPGTVTQPWVAKQRIYGYGRSHACLHGREVVGSDEGLIYQRVVDGALMAVVTLTDRDGEVVYAGAQQAEALSPEPFGASARASTVPLDPDLGRSVARLLLALGWWGLAELQFIVAADGIPLLIDFNGRFFGSLALTAAAGADLPPAWLELALGGQVTAMGPRAAVRYQWLEGDLRRVWNRPEGRVASLVEALRYAPGAAHSLWDRADPAPAVVHARSIAWRSLRRNGETLS